MQIEGCIFDFDGTLFDSMCIWDTGASDYLKSIGVTPKPDLAEMLHTTSLYQAAVYIRQEYALSLPVEAIMEGINKTVEDFYFYKAQPRENLRPALEKLHSLGIPMCIATATDEYQIAAALKRCGLAHFFRGIFTCSAVGHGKDEPDIFEASLACLGTPRAHTYVFEDAHYAALTAHKAGFPIAAFYDDHEPLQPELKALSEIYLTDFSQLTALL